MKKKKPAGSARAQRKKHCSYLTVPPEKKQRPAILAVRLAGIPAELKRRDQWVVWRLEYRDGNRTKIPYNARTGGKAKSNDPSTWTTFQEAWAVYKRSGGRYDGVMFVFSAEDPFCGVDLDDCRNPITGKVKNWARKIIADLGSYAEISPSGTGIKIYCKGSLPCERSGTRRPYKTGAVELYQFSRCFVVTGRRLLSVPKKLVDCSREIERLWHKISPPPRKTATGGGAGPSPSTSPACYEGVGVPPDVDDDALLARVRRSKKAEEFQNLWNGHWRGHYLSQSEADLALCGMLAFWTGPQPDRLDRLFRQSCLYRDKWDEVHRYDGATYGEATIEHALSEREEADFFDWQRAVPWNLIERLCDPTSPIAREFRKQLNNRIYKGGSR